MLYYDRIYLNERIEVAKSYNSKVNVLFVTNGF